MNDTRFEIISRIIDSPEKAANAFIELQKEFTEQQKQIASQQAKIDSLMLEYCPEEMSEEQIASWEKHQVRAESGEGDD